ncbi:WcbI family polysaccharide biosynthesis putative acetyltransferase [Paracoccus aminovorans]|uniref:WcbI family polysaccharide biosynthesis putative acetyltransferase n=1 Tax=Paracoccus aminovorans TaxID=34004 RepID=UPI00396F68C4
MKLVVIGNCQARPLAARLATAPGVRVADPIILHLAKEEDEAAHAEAIGGADLILAQATADNFRPRHLASNTLRADYPRKVVVWPNIFYAGQQPFLRYLTHLETGRVAGPFDVYHDLRFLALWRAERGLGPAAPNLDAEMRFARDVAQESLVALRTREADCDVGVADLVEESASERRCFYTFNHPAGWLLGSLATRLAARIDLPRLPPPPDGWEPLGRIVPPGLLLTREHAALQAMAFRVYDAAAPLLADPKLLRTTPTFAADAAWLDGCYTEREANQCPV